MYPVSSQRCTPVTLHIGRVWALISCHHSPWDLGNETRNEADLGTPSLSTYAGGSEEPSREVSGLQLTGRRARFKSCQVQGIGVIVYSKCVSKHLDLWFSYFE